MASSLCAVAEQVGGPEKKGCWREGWAQAWGGSDPHTAGDQSSAEVGPVVPPLGALAWLT